MNPFKWIVVVPFAAFSGWVLLGATGLSGVASVVPAVVATVTLVLIAAESVRIQLSRTKYATADDRAVGVSAAHAIAIVLALPVLVGVIGLTPGCALYAAAFLYRYARARPVACLAYGIVAGLIIEGLFGWLLGLELYRGMLAGA